MKRFTAIALAALSIAALAACGGPNRNEREADSITRAVVNNNVSPVMRDFDPAIKGQLTRVRVAELSDQLNADGPYQGLKQNPKAAWCRIGYLCFDATFAKRKYHEFMELGSDGKVTSWWILPAESRNT
jgi:hypothetical protein